MNSKDATLSEQLSKLGTEQRNPRTMGLDNLSTSDLVKTLHAENHLVAPAVDPTLEKVANLVDIVVDRMQKGGRLFYIGAGTSGRLGVLDASEIPPTFGVTPEMVQGLIAGGAVALVSSIEGAEDDGEQPRRDLEQRGLSSKDVVVGIAASGRTPYVIGGLEYARGVGCATAAIANVGGSALADHCDICLEAVTGAEPLTGSTRMKAGTAQKMLLNLISTAAMVRMGKVYENLMVDVKATNVKLRKRAIRIVEQATGSSSDKCESALIEVDWHAKTAIVMLLLNISKAEAEEKLHGAGGHIRRTL
ncbi:MAG: N-acetylmuramic acid 6-phosphate etherase [Candidatus Obscuribacterales bacterium]|nr:N-acetylmuramic acid 6-phosphate etherase [Candidatus Obscuribacterales bacterium]